MNGDNGNQQILVVMAEKQRWIQLTLAKPCFSAGQHDAQPGKFGAECQPPLSRRVGEAKQWLQYGNELSGCQARESLRRLA